MAADLKAELHLLKTLQDLDTALRKAQGVVTALPARREEVLRPYVEAKTALEARRREHEEAEKLKRSDELELAADVDRIKERETKLYAIKTNKEYQAVLKEIAEGKKANREREDRILKLMEAAEAAAKEITQLSSVAADKEIECQAAAKTLEEEAARLEREQAVKRAEREGIVIGLSPEVLRQYEFVRQRYPDTVAEVALGICQGCFMRLPPQQFIELQRWETLTQCPSCHRILVPAEEGAAPQKQANGA